MERLFYLTLFLDILFLTEIYIIEIINDTIDVNIKWSNPTVLLPYTTI